VYSKPFTFIPWPGWERANAEELKNPTRAYLTRCMYDDEILGVVLNQKAIKQNKKNSKKFRQKVKKSFTLIVNKNFDKVG
jgi:hypothetical protein